MVARVKLDINGGSYTFPARSLDSQSTINWYPVYDKAGKMPLSLAPTWGNEIWSNSSTYKEVRGFYKLNNLLYAVVDNKFRIYAADGSYIEKGTLDNATGRMHIIANDYQIFMSNGISGWVYQYEKSETRNIGDFFKIKEATTFIGEARFDGSGKLDDLTTSGTFIGDTNKTYHVEIDSVGNIGTADTFRWSDDGGTTWIANNVVITGNSQELNDGVEITFGHTFGHSLHDLWYFDATIDSAFFPPQFPAYLDTYGIFVKSATNRWYITSPQDFSVINALDYTNANALPDELVAAVGVREELFLFCETNTEVWIDVGLEDFPFQRRPNLLINYGCAAPFSIQNVQNNILIWLGTNENGSYSICALDGYDVKIVSNEVINIAINNYDRVDNAYAIAIDLDGHIFYHITFPDAEITWVYDLTLNMWHQRSTRRTPENISTNEYLDGRWRANNYIFFEGKHLIGDPFSGNIYELKRDSHDENGIKILRQRTISPFLDTLNRISIYSLELIFEPGISNQTGEFSDAKVMLEISKDGGISWGKKLIKQMGKIGEYKRRVRFMNLGSAREWIFRISVSDSVYSVLIGAVAELEAYKT